jgi:annexin A7/11
MKGFGTNEKELIRVLSNKDPLQIEVIKQTYHRLFHRDLIRDVEGETSNHFEKALVAILHGPLLADVASLHHALAGAGTNERMLNDVLLGRSNADIRAIKEAYQRTYHKSLESAVRGDLSMKTERHFVMVLAATRNEESAPVVPQSIDQDAMEIYKATEGRHGTDELLVCSILTQRSDTQIRAIAHTYHQKFSKDLEHVIKRVWPSPFLTSPSNSC